MISRPKHLRAFTLTEILIVIGIIVLLLGVTVPVMRVLTGGRSIDGAENQLTAFIGRARGEAIGLQEERGVMFYWDPETGRTMLAIVKVADFPAGAPLDVYLDLVEDRDVVSLPGGVDVQVIDDANIPLTGPRTDDSFIGFNTALLDSTGANSTSYRPYGGVILFDAYGQIVNRRYGFRGLTSSGANTAMYDLLYRGTGTAPAYLDPFSTGVAGPLQSQFGFVLYDREEFIGGGFHDDPDKKFSTDVQVNGMRGNYETGGGNGPPELTEEEWIEKNSVPILINRYNGTLVRGE